jgi:hypothetical protein
MIYLTLMQFKRILDKGFPGGTVNGLYLKPMTVGQEVEILRGEYWLKSSEVSPASKMGYYPLYRGPAISEKELVLIPLGLVTPELRKAYPDLFRDYC